MYDKYMLFYESPKNWGYYMHVQTVCTRPLLGGEGPGDEATQTATQQCNDRGFAFTLLDYIILVMHAILEGKSSFHWDFNTSASNLPL